MDDNFLSVVGEFKYQRFDNHYELLNRYSIIINICPEQDINYNIMSLSRDGLLSLDEGFKWDGASGPAIDTKDFMRASMIHDALYFLLRIGDLPVSYRKQADLLLYQMCRADGMPILRAWYVYYAVRLFGNYAVQRLA